MIPLVTLSSDFAVQSQGVGEMEAIVFSIAPNAKVVHLMHGLPGFDTTAAARTMEAVRFVPIGFHVCVCDPGVGTSRKGIVIETASGHHFVGPDNGLFLPAVRLLGGAVKIHELANPDYHNHPVSPIFHGRDVFSPAAAHLAIGAPIESFGESIDFAQLVDAPYDEAVVKDGEINAQIIQINRFGSIHLNILAEIWDGLEIPLGKTVEVNCESGESFELPVGQTFGDVDKGKNIIFKDDHGRVEIAKNLGYLSDEYPFKIGDRLKIKF